MFQSGGSLEPLERERGAGRAGGTRRAPCGSPRAPAPRSSSISQHHCSEIERLDARGAALAVADRVAVATPASRAGRARGATRGSRSSASSCVSPANSPARRRSSARRARPPSAPASPCVAADLEVERVVARGDLERAGAELRLDALVGDHRDGRSTNGHDDLLVRPAPGSARRRDGRRPPRRPGSSRAARWRP